MPNTGQVELVLFGIRREAGLFGNDGLDIIGAQVGIGDIDN